MNSSSVIVYKNREVVYSVALGMDVSQDTFSSDIRVAKDSGSLLIASWQISFLTDGTDGELVITLPSSVTGAIVQSVGYMDMKRLIGGTTPVAVFDDPLQVDFRNPITA